MNAGWKTTKTPEGFKWEVYQVTSSTTPFENGSYAQFNTLQTGTRPTRAKALTIAKKWVLYYRKAA